MKYLIPFVFPFLFIACGSDEESEDKSLSQEEEEITIASDELEQERKSPRIQKSVQKNGMDISFDYGSPRVKNRTIWGDLVPYDQVWRAGADEVSTVTFGNDVLVGGTLVEAGTYGMFIIPKEKEDWVFILNREWSHEEHGVWGAFDYKEEQDVVRIEVEALSRDKNEEGLNYGYDTDKGVLLFWWEKIILEIPVSPAEPA
ncbi:MAG: DUF2911 domain-containing protein [Crocinitomicaceae bacterium]